MREEESRQEHHKLVKEGNAFYEIDLDCLRARQKKEETEKECREKRQEKRQRR